jgi:hypothetical protein
MRVGYCKELSTTRAMYKYGIRKKSEYISKKLESGQLGDASSRDTVCLSIVLNK